VNFCSAFINCMMVIDSPLLFNIVLASHLMYTESD